MTSKHNFPVAYQKIMIGLTEDDFKRGAEIWG